MFLSFDRNELLSTIKKFGLRVLACNSPIPPSKKPVTVSYEKKKKKKFRQ